VQESCKLNPRNAKTLEIQGFLECLAGAEGLESLLGCFILCHLVFIQPKELEISRVSSALIYFCLFRFDRLKGQIRVRADHADKRLSLAHHTGQRVSN